MEEDRVGAWHAIKALDEQVKGFNEWAARLRELLVALDLKYSKKAQQRNEKEEILKGFLEDIPLSVINNPTYMQDWAKRTGIAAEELRRLKLERVNPPTPLLSG
jgi:hypothetical protein